MFPCAYKQLFGIDCPVCGFQRSLLHLIEGNFKESFLTYPPLVPALLAIGIFLVHLMDKNLVSRKFLMRYAVVVLVVVMLNYIGTFIFGHFY